MPWSERSPGEGIGYALQYSWTSLVAQMVKNPPAMWQTWVQSLGWEDPLEESMTTHSGMLAGRISWTEEPGGPYSPWAQKELDTTEQPSTQHSCYTRSLSKKCTVVTLNPPNLMKIASWMAELFLFFLFWKVKAFLL